LTEQSTPHSASADQAEKTLTVQREAKIYLRNIAMWGRFISAALAVVVAVFLGIVLYSYYNKEFLDLEDPSGATGGYYFTMIGFLSLLFYPAYRLFNFSRLADHAILFRDSNDLTMALRNLKSFVQVLGIISAILVTAYIAFLAYVYWWMT
jgi:magnesium-transporting ATPase (P-type)